MTKSFKLKRRRSIKGGKRPTNTNKRKYKKVPSRQRRTQRKRQVGGMDKEVDTDFVRCYEKNLDLIERQIETTSGKHRINPEQAQLFISSQKSQVRRDAAKDLIDNTIYITLNETKQIIGQLIQQVYNLEKVKKASNIYFYSGNPKKSYYFLNVLALFFIRRMGLKEPIFIKELNPSVFNTIGDNPFIILDDVSYSGSQMSTMLDSIHYNSVITNKRPPPNIIVLLIALNTSSLKALSNISLRKTASGLTIQKGKSPFDILYLPERLYTSLSETLGAERYSYVNLFFSPHTSDHPYISLYLDHKIADEASTYMKAIIYGPIIPSNYSEQYKAYLKLDEDETTQYYKNTPVHEFVNVDGFDNIDNGKENNKIEFVPFIESCRNNLNLNKLIDNQDIKNMEYFIFMVNEQLFNEVLDKNSPIGNYVNFRVNDVLDTKTPIDVRREHFQNYTTKILNLLNMLNDYKCPLSFYKQIDFTC